MTVVAGTWSHNYEQKEQTPGQKHLFLHHGEGELLKRNSILTLSGAMDTLIWSFDMHSFKAKYYSLPGFYTISYSCHQMIIPGSEAFQVGFMENGTLRQDITYLWRRKGELLERY